MIHSPNYIHFRGQWQLVGPDAPGQRFEREKFQKLWKDINTDEVAGDYDDFSYRPDRCEFAKTREEHPKEGQPFSKVVYRDDRLTIVEEWPELSSDEFAQKFSRILTAWFEHFPETLAILQRCCLRALIQPTNFTDSRQFLGDGVLRLGQQFKKSFLQMPHRVGFTVGCRRELDNGTLFIDTKVNSWRDTRSVWCEVSGTMPLKVPINATNADTAQMAFGTCKKFLECEVIRLLAEFDKKSGNDTDEGADK